MITIESEICKEFVCIADRCPDTCCAGWSIRIDDQADRYYKSVTGSFGERLDEKIDRSVAPPRFVMGPGQRCSFLNDKNLCDIYLTLGSHALCRTCTAFPRGHLKVNDLVLNYLSFACCEAARLFLTKKEPLEIMLTADENGSGRNPDFASVTDLYVDTLSVSISLLQDRSLNIRSRLMLCILFFGLQQKILDTGKMTDENVRLFSSPMQYHQLVQASAMPESDNLLRFKLFRIVCSLMSSMNNDTYLEGIYNRFTDYYENAASSDIIPAIGRAFSLYEDPEFYNEHEQLLVYLFFRYTAAYAPEHSVKIPLCCIIMIYVSYLCFVAFSSLDGKLVCFNERILILSRLSRVLEHNDTALSQLYSQMCDSHMDTPESLLLLI